MCDVLTWLFASPHSVRNVSTHYWYRLYLQKMIGEGCVPVWAIMQHTQVLVSEQLITTVFILPSRILSSRCILSPALAVGMAWCLPTYSWNTRCWARLQLLGLQ